MEAIRRASAQCTLDEDLAVERKKVLAKLAAANTRVQDIAAGALTTPESWMIIRLKTLRTALKTILSNSKAAACMHGNAIM